MLVIIINIICISQAFNILNRQFSLPFLYLFIYFNIDFIKKEPPQTLPLSTLWTLLLSAPQNLRKLIASRNNTPLYDANSAF